MPKLKSFSFILFLFLMIVLGFLVTYIGNELFVEKSPLPPSYTNTPRAYAENIRQACLNFRAKFQCYASGLAVASRIHDFRFASDILIELQRLDPIMEHCHGAAHAIGAEQVYKNPDNWETILKGVDVKACWYGFFHGIIEGLTKTDPEYVLNAATIPVLCKKIDTLIQDQVRTFDEREQMCAHIIGHILLVQEEGDIKKAITVCSGLKETYKNECYNAAFMEGNLQVNMLVIHGFATRFAWTEENSKPREAICFQFSGIVALQCWRAMSDIYVYLSDTSQGIVSNYELLLSYCGRAPFKADQDACYREGAVNFAVRMVSHTTNSDNLSLLCSPYTDNKTDMELCVRYVIENVLSALPHSVNKFLPFCDKLTKDLIEECYEYIGENLSNMVSRKEHEEICKTAPQKFVNICSQT